MRKFRSAAGPVSSGLVILVTLVASISLLLAAKGGSGRQGVSSGGSYVRAIVNGRVFTHTLSDGELAEDARVALVALIDAHPDFSASVTSIPPRIFETDDVFFEALRANGTEISKLFACENDANYQNSGVHFSTGRVQSAVSRPTAVAGGGNYNLRLDMLIAPNVDVTIATSADDIAGLIAGITSELTGLGFTVHDTGSDLVITKAGDTFSSIRVETTDTAIKDVCVGLSGSPQGPASTPTLPMLHPTGLRLLVAGLLLAGILMIWRKVGTA